MSEYQYYEFLAIDRPLTATQRRELRAMSTRAEITPVSFTNEYHWGDFKGNPATLMERYFDAHIYLANWCTCVLALRLPHEALNRKTVSAFRAGDSLVFDDTGDNWVVNWVLAESENYDRFGEDDGRGWMARLTPLRQELLRGDLRPLYLAWLAAVGMGDVKDNALEPMFPAKLDRLTAAQIALAEFIEVDPDLLAGAAAGTSQLNAGAADDAMMEFWLATLSREEAIEPLRLLLAGRAEQAQRALTARYADWRQRLQPQTQAAPRRVAELRKLAHDARRMREAEAVTVHARAQAQKRKQRERHLTNLAMDFDRAWKAASQRAEHATAAAYDEVCRAIADLAEAYTLKRSRAAFDAALRTFMETHARRGALARRLVDAGLWKR